MKAAIVCYGDMGVERAGNGDIAKLTGVSTATVFNYFGTRESLTKAVFSSIYDVFRTVFVSRSSPGSSPQEHIQDMANNFAFLVDQHPDILKVILNWSSSFGHSVRP